MNSYFFHQELYLDGKNFLSRRVNNYQVMINRECIRIYVSESDKNVLFVCCIQFFKLSQENFSAVLNAEICTLICTLIATIKFLAPFNFLFVVTMRAKTFRVGYIPRWCNGATVPQVCAWTRGNDADRSSCGIEEGSTGYGRKDPRTWEREKRR